ncbi:MAG: LLM class flavin-dependent oxidoreductase [Chloroflexi bacterium]|nr:LLM class flavin-dependent oxidoreductase [Chloroflexota bacterium]
MKVGVTVPMTASDVPAGEPFPGWLAIRDFAMRAEVLGLDSVWVFDHLVFRDEEGTDGILESWSVLAALAAATSRVELGTLVMATPFRNPAVLAKMAVTTDMVSGGRLILGLGAGWHKPEFDAFGIDFEHRFGQFEDSLRIIAPLLRGETVTHAGRLAHAEHVVLLPPPTRAIPVLVASRGPRMLRLTAELADAWNTAWHAHPDETFRKRMADMDAALSAAGRDPATLVRTSGIIVRNPDEREAKNSPPSAFGGSVEELAEILAEHAAAGIEHAIVWLEPKTPASLQRLADAVAIHRQNA